MSAQPSTANTEASTKAKPKAAPLWHYELTRNDLLKRVLKSREFQVLLILPNLFFFVVIIMAGLIGTPVGNRNFSIIFVWIVWWALLIVFMIPFGARIWCAMCPIPAPGEWLQRRAIIRKGVDMPLSVAAKGWPKRFKNIWIQNFSFLAVALFSAIILTRPMATGIVLLLFFVVAAALSWRFGRRVFCRYVCPVGGFIGLYSMAAPVEVRVKDADICLKHTEKECIRGSANGYGCPWLEYPGNMQRNTYCGMCTECLKTCTKDNIAINLRPFGNDLFVAKGRGLDEAYKAFIMLTCAVVYSVVMLGPWGWIKDWANIVSVPEFLGYTAIFLGANLLLVPGLYFASAWFGNLLADRGQRAAVETKPVTQIARPASAKTAAPLSTKKWWIDMAYALVPMGLAGWIAFSLTFVFVNVSYAIPLLSDPFGWGWNLIGTVDYHWTPYFPDLVRYLQVPILLGGLVFSILTAYRIARLHFPEQSRALRSIIPIALFLAGITSAFLILYV